MPQTIKATRLTVSEYETCLIRNSELHKTMQFRPKMLKFFWYHCVQGLARQAAYRQACIEIEGKPPRAMASMTVPIRNWEKLVNSELREVKKRPQEIGTKQFAEESQTIKAWDFFVKLPSYARESTEEETGNG